MKHIIILGDGMADEPIAALGGKTPLQAAHKPAIDSLAAQGRSGMLHTTPAGYEPGSEIANLALLGYDIPTVFEGRGSLEAASMGIEVLPGEMAMRCNLLTIEEGRIKNHSAGHISNEEATELMLFLQQELGDNIVSFHPGVSYRHLLKIKGGNKYLQCTPPHNVPGTPFNEVMIQPEGVEATETASLLNGLILRSQELLEHHPINQARRAAGKEVANSIWPWSPGYKPRMEHLGTRFDFNKGAVISAVDLIKGIGVYAGLTSIDVEGATGLYNTNYEGKAAAAVEALRTNDFVFLHIEASDEAGHEGDVALKTRTIEYLDQRIVRPIREAIAQMGIPVAIALLPDHPTPCAIKTHTSDAVPFVIYYPGITPDEVTTYDESAARQGSYGTLNGDEFITLFFKN